MEVATLTGGGRQVFIGHLEIEPLELTYPGVSGIGRPESPARAESPAHEHRSLRPERSLRARLRTRLRSTLLSALECLSESRPESRPESPGCQHRSLREITPESPACKLQQTYFEAPTHAEWIGGLVGAFGLCKALISHTPSKDIPLLIERMP